MNGHYATAIFIGLALRVPLVGQGVTDFDRFELFTECETVDISVSVQGDAANDIGLTDERV